MNGPPPLLPLALLALTPLVAGCPSPCSPSNDDPTLRIGTGEDAFVPLDPDDPTFEIVHGPQGGYHVLVALEAEGLDASELMLGDFKGYIDDVLVGETRPWLQMRCNPRTKTLQSWGSFLIWDAQPSELDGQIAHIEVDVTDVGERVAHDEVDALLYDPLLENAPPE